MKPAIRAASKGITLMDNTRGHHPDTHETITPTHTGYITSRPSTQNADAERGNTAQNDLVMITTTAWVLGGWGLMNGNT